METTDMGSLAERERRHRREAIAVSAIEWSYLRELGAQLRRREGDPVVAVPGRRVQAARSRVAIEADAGETHVKAVAKASVGARRQLGRANRSSRHLRSPGRAASGLRS